MYRYINIYVYVIIHIYTDINTIIHTQINMHSIRLRTTVGCFTALLRQAPAAGGPGVPVDPHEEQEESVLRR
jgi:hypothetical protein